MEAGVAHSGPVTPQSVPVCDNETQSVVRTFYFAVSGKPGLRKGERLYLSAVLQEDKEVVKGQGSAFALTSCPVPWLVLFVCPSCFPFSNEGRVHDVLPGPLPGLQFETD